MPTVDWARVDAEIFHAFHLSWICAIDKVLSQDLVGEFYSLIESHGDRPIEGVLQGIPIPCVGRTFRERRRTLAIRRTPNHQLVAIIELVTPFIKRRSDRIKRFASRIGSALRNTVHVLELDVVPSGPEKRLTMSSSTGGRDRKVCVRTVSVGEALPAMPLFLSADRYIKLPLNATHEEAYRAMPAFWRQVLEAAT